jgi:hypothetical protein
MKSKNKLLAALEGSLKSIANIREWADPRDHLLPANFLVSLAELEEQLPLLKKRIAAL